jgi:hypothetical protein
LRIYAYKITDCRVQVKHFAGKRSEPQQKQAQLVVPAKSISTHGFSLNRNRRGGADEISPNGRTAPKAQKNLPAPSAPPGMESGSGYALHQFPIPA